MILGLVSELLARLGNAAGNTSVAISSGPVSSSSSSQTLLVPSAQEHHHSEHQARSGSVGTVISLLSTLCRGSPTITHVSIINTIM